jgi:hypothetical protein
MTIIDWTQAIEVPTDRLPAAITDYLLAHEARDLNAALEFFTDSSTVTDEGRTHTGRKAIGDWLATSASEYTYTIEITRAARFDDRRFDAVHHLEGDVPGGVVDLHFRFSLRDGKITSLVIEP